MAVYTKFEKRDFEKILSNYSIGQLKSFKGIKEGIENTNYYLLAGEKKYVLTIYEKRVNPKDLPFFSEIMSRLNNENFKCPIPIFNNQNKTITEYKEKKLMIVSFLEGKAKKILTPNECRQVGAEVAKMHQITKNFNIKRNNDLSISSWRKLFN